MDTILTATGEYCILYPPGGALVDAAEARFQSAAAMGDALLYADHTIVFKNGQKKLVSKPDWSPDTLLSANYIDGPIVVRRSLLPAGCEGAFATPEGRYALLLLLSERARSITHIDESLMTCAAEPPCVSPEPIRHALRRRRIRARVEAGTLPGSFAVRYAAPPDTRISVIVYGHAGVRDIRGTLESVATVCCWPRLELIIADNGEAETQKERYYALLHQNRAAEVIRSPATCCLAHILNIAAMRADGEALLFLPAGLRLASPDAVERMLELALLRHVNAVGGVTVRQGARASGIIRDVRSFDNVAMMTRRNRFFAGGGFDETLAEAGFVRAYTLLNVHGGRLYNVITPYARFCDAGAAEEVAQNETNRMRLRDLLRIAEDYSL